MTDVAAISALEDRRYAAAVADDYAALDELLSDRLVYTHSNASVDTKASFIESLRSGRLKYRAIRRLEENITLYNDTAIISSHVNLDITAAGADRTINARATIVWVRDGDAWRFAAWQSTPVPA